MRESIHVNSIAVRKDSLYKASSEWILLNYKAENLKAYVTSEAAVRMAPNPILTLLLVICSLIAAPIYMCLCSELLGLQTVGCNYSWFSLLLKFECNAVVLTMVAVLRTR